MPGFRSACGFEGTERVDLGDGCWADVKRCLSAVESGFVEAAMTGRDRPGVSGAGRRAFREIDVLAGRTEMVVQSLTAWNVTGGDGSVRPLGAGLPAGTVTGPGENPYPPGCPRRVSVAELSSAVFGRIWARCDDLNSPVKAGAVSSGR